MYGFCPTYMNSFRGIGASQLTKHGCLRCLSPYFVYLISCAHALAVPESSICSLAAFPRVKRSWVRVWKYILMAESRTHATEIIASTNLLGSASNKVEPLLLVHGGAGDITEARVPGKITGIRNAVLEGHEVLRKGGCALDAVEAAVKSMELDDNFNAGYGSVLNLDGNVELEASIMNGKNFRAGCVTLIKDILHPISVARRVMEKTNHTFIGGEGAMRFARAENFKVQPEGSLVTDNAKLALAEFIERQCQGLSTVFARTELDRSEPGEPGTVGAVAIDGEGNIAVATSTGGITGKIPGRIGDTPVLGSGTYADNEIGGVSTTGHGETIMRYNLAVKILEKIKYEKVSAQVATEECVREMTERLTGTGGAITVDRNGDVGIYFSSKRMAWAYVRGIELHYGINHGDDTSEIL